VKVAKVEAPKTVIVNGTGNRYIPNSGLLSPSTATDGSGIVKVITIGSPGKKMLSKAEVVPTISPKAVTDTGLAKAGTVRMAHSGTSDSNRKRIGEPP